MGLVEQNPCNLSPKLPEKYSHCNQSGRWKKQKKGPTSYFNWGHFYLLVKDKKNNSIFQNKVKNVLFSDRYVPANHTDC